MKRSNKTMAIVFLSVIVLALFVIVHGSNSTAAHSNIAVSNYSVVCNDAVDNNITSANAENNVSRVKRYCYADSYSGSLSYEEQRQREMEQQAMELVGKTLVRFVTHPSWENCGCLVLSIVFLFLVVAGRPKQDNKP